MSIRVDYRKVMPEALEAMLRLQRTVDGSSPEPELLELVKMRASQLNGCAYCLDMHSKDALALGEKPQRLLVLAAWREAPFYSERERAALAWCEALTTLSESGAPESVYKELAALFDPKEIVALTLAIVAINGWNRLAVGLGANVGSYISRRQPAASTAHSI